MYRYLLFDLDGTLTDSSEGIFNSVRHALTYYGLTATDAELQPFIGPPLEDSFQDVFGFTHEQALEAREKYREYYEPHGILENRVYPGIPEALKKLRENGRMLMVATSKPEEYAVKILAHFGLDQQFDIIAGATMDSSRQNKDDVIRYLLAQVPDMEYSLQNNEILMIGDRKYDVLGAKAVGIPCLGVGFGYAYPNELEEAGAVKRVETVEEMTDWILNH